MVFVYSSAYGITGFSLLGQIPSLWCVNSLQEKYGPYYIDDGEEGVGIGCHDGAEVLQFRDFPVQRSLVFDCHTFMVIYRLPYIHVRFLMIVH